MASARLYPGLTAIASLLANQATGRRGTMTKTAEPLLIGFGRKADRNRSLNASLICSITAEAVLAGLKKKA
jgi:hypothetical protein